MKAMIEKVSNGWIVSVWNSASSRPSRCLFTTFDEAMAYLAEKLE